MNFFEVKKLELTPFQDLRGELVKIYHRETASNAMHKVDEIYVSRSKKGTVRGLHFQLGDKGQDKFIYCISGRLIDVSVDLSPNGEIGKVHVEELKGGDPVALIIPHTFAHGVIALEDDTTFISMSPQSYSPMHERGIRWDTLGIDFGIQNPIITDKDLAWPSLQDVISSVR